jgi:hypothetical protein
LKVRGLRLTFAVIVLFVTTTAARAADDEAGVRALLKAYSDARARADAVALKKLVAPNADFWDNTARTMLTGTDAEKQAVPTAPADRRVDVEHVSFINPNVAIIDANYSGGRNNGHVIYVVVKRGGSWLIRSTRVVQFNAPN